MAKIVWTEKATDHLQAIHEYIAQRQTTVPILAVIHGARDFAQAFLNEWEI